MMVGEAENYFQLQMFYGPKEWIVEDIMQSPDMGSKPENIWHTGIGAWMFGPHQRPSAHSIMNGISKLGMAEKEARIGKGFGATLASYYPEECGRKSPKLKIMEEAYHMLLNQFGWEAPEGFVEKTNCNESLLEEYPENIFSFAQYWDAATDGREECDRVDYQTDYSVYNPMSYLMCASEAFGTTPIEEETDPTTCDPARDPSC